MYFAGLSISPTKDSYERELDDLVGGVSAELGTPTAIKKIGLTLSPQIAAQRPDIETIVGDLSELYFDGILFIPRPAYYARSIYMADDDLMSETSLKGHLDRFLISLIQRTSVGLIAFDLGAEQQDYEIEFMKLLINIIPGCFAEAAYLSDQLGGIHLLAKYNDSLLKKPF